MKCVIPKEEEYNILRNNIAYVNMNDSSIFIEVKGDDVQEYLDKVLSKNVLYLQMNDGLDTLLLDEGQNVIDVVSLLNNDEVYCIIASKEKESEVLSFLQNNKNDFDVDISVKHKSVSILAGPYSWKVVKK